MSGYETYRHEVDAWTVGQLRASLDGVPDDWPIEAYAAEDPGGEFEIDQVVFWAGPVDPAASGGAVFGIGCEFPLGDYERPT